MTNEPEKKPKDANEMTDEELIRSVYPPYVVERVRHELGLDEEEETEDDDLTPSE